MQGLEVTNGMLHVACCTGHYRKSAVYAKHRNAFVLKNKRLAYSSLRHLSRLSASFAFRVDYSKLTRLLPIIHWPLALRQLPFAFHKCIRSCNICWQILVADTYAMNSLAHLNCISFAWIPAAFHYTYSAAYSIYSHST